MTLFEQGLRKEIRATLTQVGAQIDSVTDLGRRLGIDPYKLQDERGNLLLTPLVAAKAQLLHSLTMLETKEK